MNDAPKVSNLRYNLLASKIKNTIFGIALLSTLFVINVALDLVAFKDLFAESDLEIPSLYEGGRLTPFDGYDSYIYRKETQYFPEGVIVNLSLRHNNEGNETVSIRKIGISVVKNANQVNLPKYQKDISKVHGQGFRIKRAFRVLLSNNGVETAFSSKDGNPSAVSTENLLEGIKSEIIDLRPQNDSKEDIKLILAVKDSGIYRISINLGYEVGGDSLIHKTVEDFYVYKN